jgi:hypothetical protein
MLFFYSARILPEHRFTLSECAVRYQLPLVGVSALAFATGFGLSIGKNV